MAAMGSIILSWALSVGIGSIITLGPIPAQAQLNKQDLMTESFALAHQMGKTYQMQVDCVLNSDITPERAMEFFINYMTNVQVQLVMNAYGKGMKQVEKKVCNKEELTRTLKALMESMSSYTLYKKHRRP
jgi:hypothetical protein